ncbi:MAG TPA: NUDIX domain-containing protein [Solirubrobacteraceae bacterium]|jgi:ADP-ribose pyrophosphatase YjhB (NUDIX family)
MIEPLPQAEFEAIFSRVPRLTVELLIWTEERGVLVALRESGPCRGLWHLPGGTVRFGEPLTDAVRRVAAGELGIAVEAGELLGYIEYPSHYENGLDSPVGIAFRAEPVAGPPSIEELRSTCRWCTATPTNMHDEQREFLARELGIGPAPHDA